MNLDKTTTIYGEYGFFDSFNLDTSTYNETLSEKLSAQNHFFMSQNYRYYNSLLLEPANAENCSENFVGFTKKSLPKIWVDNSYLAIDQGPIAIMIENYKSQLIWNLFMSHTDIKKLVQKLSNLNQISGGEYPDWEFFDIPIHTDKIQALYDRTDISKENTK